VQRRLEQLTQHSEQHGSHAHCTQRALHPAARYGGAPAAATGLLAAAQSLCARVHRRSAGPSCGLHHLPAPTGPHGHTLPQQHR
jgi:hypothetical protein